CKSPFWHCRAGKRQSLRLRLRGCGKRRCGAATAETARECCTAVGRGLKIALIPAALQGKQHPCRAAQVRVISAEWRERYHQPDRERLQPQCSSSPGPDGAAGPRAGPTQQLCTPAVPAALCSPFPAPEGHRDSWPADEWHSPSAPVNVTVKHLKANSAVVTWDVLEDEVVIGFAISQQKKDVRMLRFIQEVNTTTRSCALWDLEEDTEYIVHVQAISIQGQSPASEPVLFKTPREAEKLASKNKDEVTMKEMAKKNQQLRAGEILIIVVVLFMWAGVIALFCRQYDIIKDNEPNNSKEKAKSASENSTPEHQGGGLLRSKFPKNKPSVNIIEA
uniref:Fibronectin type III domain containing 5 n=1 Tax=Gallus gallus TaxID=9031 RepID=A0A8V0YW16_CHICK